MGVRAATDLGRYLGLPSFLGRNKSATFKYIEESVRTRIGIWMHKFLSRADSLTSRILKAKYYPTTDFMSAQIGKNPSYIWRSIMAGQQVLRLGIARRIGNGLDTKIWGWNWLAGTNNEPLHTPCAEHLREARVRGLFDAHGRWDVDIVRDIFLDVDVRRILSTPINTHVSDNWRWLGDIQGSAVSVEEAYKRILHSQTTWMVTYAPVQRPSCRTTEPERWTPPPHGAMKCNVDAATFDTGASFGAVIRDHGGTLIAAKSGWLEGIDDPFLAEVLAAKEALSWMKTQGQANWFLESDCLNFCNAFNSCNVNLSYVGLIVKQCLSIATDMGSVKVVHAKRTANRVAHELARATVSEAVSGEWNMIPPTCIVDVLRC
ncbi:PREDICTED: uncharacterized protein LOC109181162 [Ipomoea nil]|uniref:uncharacterized protein LOC109181162 n=1 Tax=Ipomoea nil TaxID=35883 RepID=UPI0009018761|nr:PREDICTED: uncharacterized protein LOC109181162 [Ipomoea nil]